MCFVIPYSPQDCWQRTQSTYNLNPHSIGPPTRFVEWVNGDPIVQGYWTFSMYVELVVKKVQMLLQDKGCGLKAKTILRHLRLQLNHTRWAWMTRTTAKDEGSSREGWRIISLLSNNWITLLGCGTWKDWHVLWGWTIVPTIGVAAGWVPQSCTPH